MSSAPNYLPRFRRPPRFVLALGAALVVAVCMTCISIYIYVRSGVANIDLSRPGYEAVRKDVKTVDNSQAFSSNGPMDVKTVDQFNTLYTAQSKDLHSFDDFSKDVINNDNLNMPLSQ